METYPQGQEVTITGTFRMEGVLRDPGNSPGDQDLVLRHQRSGAEIDLTPVKISDGIWAAYVTPPIAGEWRYDWRVVAPYVTAQHGKLYVEAI